MNKKNRYSGDSTDELNHSTEMRSYILPFGRGVLKLKWLILTITLLFTVVTIPGLSKLNITVNIESFFLEDDPIVKNQKKFRKLFNNTDFVGVLVENDDIFSRKSLNLIKEIGDRLFEDVPLAKEVVSLVNVKLPFSQGAKLKFRKGKLTSSDRSIKRFKTFCRKTNSLKGKLFSTDNRQAWVLLKLHPYPSTENWKGTTDPLFSVGKAGYDTVKSINSGSTRLTATGVPVYAYRKEAEMMKDLLVVLGIGTIVALFLSIIIFRSFQGVIGTLLVIILSVLFVLGVQGLMGVAIDSAFLAVPILLAMGVSIGYTVHITRFFNIHFNQTGERKDSILFALEKSAKPIFFTAFTTGVALVSFVFVKIKPIQWVGITSAFCILAVYILSIFLFPIILSFGRNREKTFQVVAKTNFFEPALKLFAHWVGKYSVRIIIIFIIVSAIAVKGLLQLKVDFNAEKMTGTELQHMKDQIHVGKSQIATSDTLDLVLVLPSKGLTLPENLKKIEKLEEKILKLSLVKKTSSLVGAVKEFNYFGHERNSYYYRVPKGKGRVKILFKYFKIYAPEYLYSWTTKDLSTTRIFIELTEFSSMGIEKNIKEIKKYIDELFPSETTYFFSGSTYQMAVMNQYITRGLIQSVLTALGMITLLMIIVFKSVKLGLAAMVPNIFPVLIAGGIMGYLNVPLEFVTMTVAPLIMGLAVDDTIHLLWHLKEDLKESNDFKASVAHTFSVVGSAISETTIILCITFLVFTFSKVNSIINMGILTCSGMAAAYLADIFVTPILIKKLKY